MALGTVEVVSPRVQGEEIDISPVLLLGIAGKVMPYKLDLRFY